jgi:hypothetical protein
MGADRGGNYEIFRSRRLGFELYALRDVGRERLERGRRLVDVAARRQISYTCKTEYHHSVLKSGP